MKSLILTALLSSFLAHALPQPDTSILSTPLAPASCPPNFSTNSFQFPHAIVSIDSAHPDTTTGESYFGTVTPSVTTLFSFDIPASYASHTCSLRFFFPAQSSLRTSSFTFSGNGELLFSKLASEFTASTTWNSRPGFELFYPYVQVAPGQVADGYLIASFPCLGGQTMEFAVGAPGGNTNLRYFQDDDPSAIGLYIFVC